MGCRPWLLWHTPSTEGLKAEMQPHCSFVSRDSWAFRGEGPPQMLQTQTRDPAPGHYV